MSEALDLDILKAVSKSYQPKIGPQNLDAELLFSFPLFLLH